MPFTLTHENICFSNPAAKYAPGDKLEGLIELNFQKDYNVLYMQRHYACRETFVPLLVHNSRTLSTNIP
ncbi:Protein CBG25445 [Caenorhabditis briggsae]|uniref:Protein CBG25445 n=1 Tax=Caenorhabditis briggsae TaxID=6238 RepID=B6IER6_CAEBR|nr:Protein CBG25445 [Caenorhabditis briggsae]CAR98396.1 Protein CBG25445 [Caenorhabditis briggsae]